MVQNLAQDTRGGRIPSLLIPYSGSAPGLVDAIEARTIGIVADLGVTLVASDLTIETVQGA